MTSISLCFFLFFAGVQPPQAPAQAPPPATGVIRGRVIAGDTGQPLRNAQVRLNQVAGPGGDAVSVRENRTIATDSQGRYELKNLPAGRYFLNASKGAYIDVPWDRQQSTGPGKPLDLAAGERLDRMDFTLPRGGVITGRIVDEFGEPLSGLQVAAMRAQTIGGKRQMMHAGEGTTNDIGEFRIFGLASGQYCVQAIWRRMGSGDPTSPDRTGYPVTFFPGTTDEAEAQRFTVAAGQTIGDLAMALSPIKTARVEGIVVDADGRPMGNAYLVLMSSIGGNNTISGGQSARPDGQFTFASVAPGDYVFRAQSAQENKNTGELKLTVGNEDVTGLRITALPPAVVTGRVLVDPSVPPPAGFSLAAMAVNQVMPGGFARVAVADDLTFEITATAGRNRINAFNLPPGWTVRSVRVNSIEVIDEGIEVKAADRVTGVEIELTNRIATLSGLVTNARGEPAKAYTVLVFPADDRRWKPGGRYLRTANPERDGRYRMSSVVPADYYIIALDKVEPGAWNDPEFLERVRSKATSVSIGEGETKSVDLKLIAAR